MSKINWDLKNVGSRIAWNKLKTLRLEKKLTQVQLSVHSGVAVATIWMVESGFDRATSEGTKRKLATFFKCNISDLFPAAMIGSRPRDEYLEGMAKD